MYHNVPISYYRLYLHNRLTYRSIGYFYKSKTKTSVCLMSTLATLSVSWLRFVSNLSKVIGSRLALLELLVFTGIVVVVGCRFDVKFSQPGVSSNNRLFFTCQLFSKTIKNHKQFTYWFTSFSMHQCSPSIHLWGAMDYIRKVFGNLQCFHNALPFMVDTIITRINTVPDRQVSFLERYQNDSQPVFHLK